MKEIKYNKLVRDLIPEVIKNSSKKAVIKTLNSEEYYNKLKEKLQEEVDEFSLSDNVEEIADILEVIEALLNYKNITGEEIQKIKQTKKDERGAFTKRILLEKVVENDE